MPGIYRACVIFSVVCLSFAGGCATESVSLRSTSESFVGRTPEDVLKLEIELTKAADAGDVDAVRSLLKQGAGP